VTRRERARRRATERDTATEAAIVELIREVEPALSRELVTGAVMSVATGRGARTRLLKQLQADRSLLTSGGSRATLAVCRLAARLRTAGATTIVLPRCGRCDREAELVKRAHSGGICAACYNRARVAECGTCGRRRRIAGRRPDGAPQCSSCRAHDPSRHEACSRCGRSVRSTAAGSTAARCARPARSVTGRPSAATAVSSPA
jgi:hypothetical protein